MDLDAQNEITKMDEQNQNNIEKNLENMKNAGINNEQYELEEGGKNAKLELPRQKNERIKENISKNKQTDTK